MNIRRRADELAEALELHKEYCEDCWRYATGLWGAVPCEIGISYGLRVSHEEAA